MVDIPGVGMRACSLATNEFQAASMGRGRAVTITVSSTSHTTPTCCSSETTVTLASVTSEPSACM